MIVIRLILLPFKVVLALLGVTFKTGLRVGRAPLRLSGRLVRVPGIRGWFFFLVGLAIGLLLAPRPGRELRHQLQKLLAGNAVSDSELDSKVSFELAHAPRTWHLPQPVVTVSSGRVQLNGVVSSEDECDELARVAGAIPGVAGVDNLLTVVAAGPAPAP